MDTASRPQILETPDVIINPFAFAAPPSGLSISPGHWWDLSDDGAWNDSVGTWDLTEFGTVGISSGGGPNGQDVAVFDATGDYLKIASKNPVTEGYDAAFSLSVWAYHTSFNTGNYGNYYAGWRGVSGSVFHFDFNYYGSTADSFSIAGPKAGAISNATGVSESTNTWYHIAATWDGSTQKLYVNGNLEDSDANTQTAYNGAIDFFVGTSYPAGSASLQMLGRLGMLGLFPGALTADDIAYLYNSGDGRQFADL